MFKFKIFIIIIIVFFYTTNTYSQNFAYANLDKLIKTSDVGKNIISYFSKKNENLIQEQKTKEKLIKEKEKNLISQKNILEPNEYSLKVDKLKSEILEFNANQKKKMKKINEEKDNVSQLFQNEINVILKEFAEKNNIDIIFSSNQMLIGKSNLDVTDKLLKIVNTKLKKFKFN